MILAIFEEITAGMVKILYHSRVEHEVNARQSISGTVLQTLQDLARIPSPFWR